MAAPRSGAEVFLQVLRNMGVEKLFGCSGTEWAPLWEALARQKAEGIPGPDYLLARHEDTTIGMAIGYAKATGKLAVALVHSSVGASRMLMGLRGAYQERVPILLCSGDSISFGEGRNKWVGFHWGRYLADYGGPARYMEPATKSSFGLNHSALLAGTVQRACQMAKTAPQGPVFLALPFEYLAKESDSPILPASGYTMNAWPDPEGLREVADLLKAAEKPLIIVERLGRDQAAVEDLVRVAEVSGAIVVESQHPEYVNFPRDHDLHGGFIVNPYLPETDFVLVLDVIGPAWFPETEEHPPHAKIAVISEDPLRERVPFYGIAADINLQGRADAGVAELRRILEQGEAKARSAQLQTWIADNRARRDLWRANAKAASSTTPIDTRWLCQQLNEHMSDDVVIVDETIIANFTMMHVMDRLGPGQYVNAMNGGLGTGLGAALGVKVAWPEKQVVAIMGDGTFNYNAPLPALSYCQEYHAPITIIIVNNSGYRAMKMALEEVSPEGVALSTGNLFGCDLNPSVDYEKMAELVGGYGEQVSDPAEVMPAMARAFEANRRGQAAILNILVGDDMQYLGDMVHPA